MNNTNKMMTMMMMNHMPTTHRFCPIARTIEHATDRQTDKS